MRRFRKTGSTRLRPRRISRRRSVSKGRCIGRGSEKISRRDNNPGRKIL
jgi:hypothetical protein